MEAGDTVVSPNFRVVKVVSAITEAPWKSRMRVQWDVSLRGESRSDFGRSAVLFWNVQ
jgi:hypothetical protein